MDVTPIRGGGEKIRPLTAARAANGRPSTWRNALEESIIAFFIALIINLAQGGFVFPPTAEAVYGPVLVGLLWGLKTWAESRALQTQLPPGGE